MTGEICKDTSDVTMIRYRRTREVSVNTGEKAANLFLVLNLILLIDNALVMTMTNE
jgi:hypothetical protein